MKRLDLEEFKEMRTRFVAESREEVERLRNLVAEVTSLSPLSISIQYFGTR